MVIYNLNIKNISVCPGKTHTPLFVDTDAVLACTVPFQCFQAVAWRRPQKIKSRRSIQLNQLPLGHSTDGLPAAWAAPLEQGLSVFTTKTLDHQFYYISIFDILQVRWWFDSTDSTGWSSSRSLFLKVSKVSVDQLS
jgi:hypothetical protein